LPNWVAAKLLLRPNGRAVLIYTKAIKKLAERLKKVLESDENIPVSWFEIDHADGNNIFDRVRAEAVRLAQPAGTKIGLNYTGGTKMMSVHAHRAIRSAKIHQPTLSYLIASRLALKFDDGSEFPVALAPEVRISIDKLLELHGNQKPRPEEKIARGAAAAGGLAIVHSVSSGHEIWKQWYNNNLRKSGSIDLAKFPTEEDFSDDVETHLNTKRVSAMAVKESVRKAVSGYRLVLDGLRVQGGSELKEAAGKSGGEFIGSKDLANWFNGLWLEHYTLSRLEACRPLVSLNDDGLSTNLQATSEEGREFQADVLALRGYQLYYFSCYTGSDKGTAKLKLFEAIIRAKQLGGEEARAAVVACIDNPDHLRAQVEKKLEEDSGERQFEVFGRSALSSLAGELKKWFDRERR